MNVFCNVVILGDFVVIWCWFCGYFVLFCGIYCDGNLLSVNGGVYVIENFIFLD